MTPRHALAALALAALAAAPAARAADPAHDTPHGFKVLHAFTGADGTGSDADLLLAPDGNLYGTAPSGGAHGLGTVWRLRPDGRFQVLHAFRGDAHDGAGPASPLIVGPDGALWGTTTGGGANGLGTVYRLTAEGRVEVMWSFAQDDALGYAPQGGLLLASDGLLYGTTYVGGATWGGAAFSLRPGEAPTWIADLDGANASLVEDAAGHLFGSTNGGADVGTLFELTKTGALTVLHWFDGEYDGMYPHGVVLDKHGGVLATTSNGGSGGCGTVWRDADDAPSGDVVAFYRGSGCAPFSTLLRLRGGSFVGTTAYDGPDGAPGTVFAFGAGEGVRNIHVFAGAPDPGGSEPHSGVIQGADGALYGTTTAGGAFGYGTVYRLEHVAR